MNVFLLALLLAVSGMGVAAAAEPQPRALYAEASQPGESMDAFAARISGRALAWSNSSGLELCGEFREDGDRLVIDLYTMGRERACGYVRTTSPDYTGISFHTHPHGVQPRFSEDDYGHPGYLAAGRELLYQHGRDTVRPVK